MYGIENLKTEFKNTMKDGIVDALTVIKENNRANEFLSSSKYDDVNINLYHAVVKGDYNKLGPICALAKIGYKAGSKIGLIISTLSIADTLIDNELNKQFLIPGTLDVCPTKINKVFVKLCQGNGNGKKYKRTFEEFEFINVISISGLKQLILLALPERIKEFATNLENASNVTQEDLVNIGKDLNVVATVMSEIEIDSAKDRDKKNGMIDISEFMAQGINLKSKKFLISNNFSDVVSSKKGYMGATEFNFGIDEQRLLSNYEVYIAELDKRRETEKLDDRTYLKEKKRILRQCVIVDALSEVSEEIVRISNETMLKPLVDLYMASNNDLLKFDYDLSKGATGDELAKIKENKLKVEKIAVVIMEMINSKFEWNKAISITKTEELATAGRNIIYTAGKKHGFTPRETFLIAAGAGWKDRNGAAKLDKKGNVSLKFKAVETLFSNEMKCQLNSEVMRSTIDIELPDELFEIEDAINHGQLLNFVNGQAYICTNDKGEDIVASRLDEEDFTGPVIVTIDEEGYLVFLEDMNPYKFDEVEYLLFDTITDSLNPDSKMSEDLFEDMIASQINDPETFKNIYEKSVLRNVRNKPSEEDNNPRIKMTERLNITQSLLSMIKSSDYACGMNQDYMFMRLLNEDKTPGNTIFVGSICSFEVSKAVQDYDNLIPMVTPVGIILLTQ